jgi:hypothetical protein
MQIKHRNEILNDLVTDSKKYPKGWIATFGKDPKLLSNDYYIANPKVGIYLLKEYQKNPFHIKGMGTKIARHLDEDIQEKITKQTGDFGIIQGNIKKIISSLDKGIHPQKIFEEGLKGNDLGINMPLRGKASHSNDSFSLMKETFSTKQKKIDTTCEKMMSEDGLYDSYR